MSFLEQLDPKNTHKHTLTIDLDINPDMGSRQIVIKFRLFDYQNRFIQEEAATWRINYKEPIPVPEDEIDPTKVTQRKPNPTAQEKQLEEEILRRQREKEEQEAEEEQIEQEIRKKSGEDWLRKGEEERKREEEEKEKERIRQEEAYKKFMEGIHKQPEEAHS